jgi:hypothetical protein
MVLLVLKASESDHEDWENGPEWRADLQGRGECQSGGVPHRQQDHPKVMALGLVLVAH